MPVTSRTPLGAAVHTRKWWLDVNTGTLVAPTWTPVLGFQNQTFNPDNPQVNDISDMDASGFKSNQKDAADWSFAGTVFRKVLPADATSYDPGQEYLRTHAIGQFGIQNTVQIRVYEMEPGGPRVEAYLGLANIVWAGQQGGMDADDTVQVTLNGNGALTAITHPDTGSAVPVISGVSDRAYTTAGLEQVIITGNHFTGTTGITFAGTAATDFEVVSDGLIAAICPAHAGGTGALVLTNGAGASTTGGTVTYA